MALRHRLAPGLPLSGGAGDPPLGSGCGRKTSMVPGNHCATDGREEAACWRPQETLRILDPRLPRTPSRLVSDCGNDVRHTRDQCKTYNRSAENQGSLLFLNLLEMIPVFLHHFADSAMGI